MMDFGPGGANEGKGGKYLIVQRVRKAKQKGLSLLNRKRSKAT